MPLLAELTNDQLTDIRSGEYQILQFVCMVPNTVVVRFQPSVAPPTSVFAEITVGSIATGSMSDIEEGQLVIFSATSDHQATEFYRTRVRKVSGTATLYVGENSQTLTTSHYVTVIDTYEVQERLRRDVTRVDWEILFRKLRPIETALKSAYVLTNGATTWNETASPIVMDAGASSISSHAWSSSNSNDVLNSGGTTATPNFTLQAGAFRWLTYEYEDNLGNGNYRKIPVWTVPRNYANAVTLGFGAESGELANINFDPELGWTCSIPAFAGIDSLLNRTLTVVACDEWYGGRANADRQSIHTNINFIGYLQTESVQTRADEQHGQISETQFTIESFGHQLERQNIAPVTIIQRADSAGAWDEIQNPTPGRMLTYRLTEYSTASTLMAIQLPADDDDFIGDDLTLSTEKALDDLIQIGATINAEIQFDITGKLELCRDLIYSDDTARDNAPVVATLSPGDFDGDYTIDFEYGFTTSQVTITGGDYETASDRYDLTEAIAPAVARYGEGDPFELSNQVLTTNATQSEANTELAQRAANFLAGNNPTWILRARVKAEWRSVMIPDVGSWWKFDITDTDTVRGKTFGVNDRWQLVQVTSVTNSELGNGDLDCVWRHETRSTGASVRAAPIVHDEGADIDYVPAVLPPFTGGDTSLTDDTWYDSQDPRPPSTPNPVEPDCELFGFRPKGVDEIFTGSVGTNYVSILVRGNGILQEASDATEYDFSTGANGFSALTNSDSDVGGDARPASGQPAAGSIGGSGWNHADYNQHNGTPARAVYVHIDLGSPLTVRAGQSLVATFDYTKGNHGGGFTAWRIQTKDAGGVWTIRSNVTAAGTNNGTNLTLSWTPGSDTVIHGIAVWLRSDNGTPRSGSVTLKSVAIPGTDEILGDALYYSTDSWQTAVAYDAGDGLHLEESQPAAPPYNDNHEYFFPQVEVQGLATIHVEFRHASYVQADMSNWSLEGVVCEVPDPI